ncbi:Alpha/beta hydrolase fold-1 [Boeremia exigua]|uniref:Alpha/beta hydrolase fold-1 n=1 Tax=Boeremia exigua TaxID=749465 RepID=UPI001E8EC545|nr:Alpha/beta hydrolase fold-1 [Boeremia exigua]KAH6637963.1 Alpha/beta hydrolase fold-1 [Boeremia exigua]
MSPAKPTILIVPGSFTSYGIYDSFLDLLRAQSFTAFAIKLPSTQKRHPLPPATLQDDAAHVRAVVESLIAEGEGTEVVVVAHSYGGAVATEALSGLGVGSAAKGGVRRVVYLSAIALRVGETMQTALQPASGFPPEIEGYMHMDPTIMAHAVCNDLPYAQAYQNAVLLEHHSGPSFNTAATQESYKELPITYIFCEKDFVVAPDAQQRFIDTIEEVSGKKVDVKRIDSGHCPNWSQPEALLKLIVDATLL